MGMLAVTPSPRSPCWIGPRPPLALAGAFLAGYGVARFIGEFFRQPDAFLGFLFGVDDSAVGRNINPLQPLLAGIFRIPERRVRLDPEDIRELRAERYAASRRR